MKKFIMCCPYQPEGRLDKVPYKTTGNEKLTYEKETCFPIIPAISGYTEKGEEVELLLICADYENAKNNAKKLEEEVRCLEAERDIKININEIPTPYSENINDQLMLFMSLIHHIHDGDELYACITYGSKPTPIVEMMAMNYGRRALSNVSLGAVIYGLYRHGNDFGYLYDVTSLCYMDEIVRNIADMRLDNPEEMLKQLMGLE